MVIAYVLINTSTGREYSLYDDVVKIKGVKDATIVYGLYDMVVKAETENLSSLSYLVDQIREIAGISATLTLVEIEG